MHVFSFIYSLNLTAKRVNNHLCHSDLELRKQHLVDLIDLMETHQIQTGINYKAIITEDFNSNTTTEYIAYI